MDDLYRAELELAIRAVRQAAHLCRAVRSGMDGGVMEKTDLSPVTVADFGSQALVCRLLQMELPADPVIAEEDSAELREPGNATTLDAVVSHVRHALGDATAEQVCGWIDHGNAKSFSGRFWTLDPIDGTKGYLRNGQYAVSLALIVNGEVMVAAMACPNLENFPEKGSQPGLIFAAVKGEGATVQAIDGDELAGAQPVRVSEAEDPSLARFCESVESGHSAHDDSARIAERLGIHLQPTRLDSQAKYAVVARGEAEIYLRLPTRKDYREKIWDHAGGLLIAEEAGATVTDVTGLPLDFRHGRELSGNRGVVVTNGKIHFQVIDALRAEGIA